MLGANTKEAISQREQVGKINLTEFTTFVAVQRDIALEAITKLNASKVKVRRGKVRLVWSGVTFLDLTPFNSAARSDPITPSGQETQGATLTLMPVVQTTWSLKKPWRLQWCILRCPLCSLDFQVVRKGY